MAGKVNKNPQILIVCRRQGFSHQWSRWIPILCNLKGIPKNRTRFTFNTITIHPILNFYNCSRHIEVASLWKYFFFYIMGLECWFITKIIFISLLGQWGCVKKRNWLKIYFHKNFEKIFWRINLSRKCRRILFYGCKQWVWIG